MKSLIFASLSGVALAGAAQFARYGTSGELALGPYAAFVFVALPALFSTVAMTFFLFNFPLQGQRLHASAYFGTRLAQHAIGIVAGVVWGAGILGCFLLRSTPSEQVEARDFAVYSAFGSFVLAAAWGLSVLPLPERLRPRKGVIAGAVAAFAAAVYFLGYAVAN